MAEIYEGMWDFDGSCAPNEDGSTKGAYQPETFSLGCFQWVGRSGGKGFKPGKVQYRVKGVTHDPAPAYAKAREYCAKKNAQKEDDRG